MSPAFPYFLVAFSLVFLYIYGCRRLVVHLKFTRIGTNGGQYPQLHYAALHPEVSFIGNQVGWNSLFLFVYYGYDADMMSLHAYHRASIPLIAHNKLLLISSTFLYFSLASSLPSFYSNPSRHTIPAIHTVHLYKLPLATATHCSYSRGMLLCASQGWQE